MSPDLLGDQLCHIEPGELCLKGAICLEGAVKKGWFCKGADGVGQTVSKMIEVLRFKRESSGHGMTPKCNQQPRIFGIDTLQKITNMKSWDRARRALDSAGATIARERKGRKKEAFF